MAKPRLAFRFKLALAALGLLAGPLHAIELRKGETAVVKAGSIWFLDAAKLAEWQALKAAGDTAVLRANQDKILGTRDAFQFTDPLEVLVLDYEPAAASVQVEMKMPGRMQGTTWFLDRAAIE